MLIMRVKGHQSLTSYITNQQQKLPVVSPSLMQLCYLVINAHCCFVYSHVYLLSV